MSKGEFFYEIVLAVSESLMWTDGFWKKQLREKVNIRLVHSHYNERIGHESEREEEIGKDGSKAKVDGKKVEKRQWTFGVRETECNAPNG